MHQGLLRLSRELLAKPLIGDTRSVLDVCRQHRLVTLREQLGQPRPGGEVIRAGGREVGGACADRVRGSHRHDRRRQTLRDVL